MAVNQPSDSLVGGTYDNSKSYRWGESTHVPTANTLRIAAAWAPLGEIARTHTLTQLTVSTKGRHVAPEAEIGREAMCPPGSASGGVIVAGSPAWMWTTVKSALVGWCACDCVCVIVQARVPVEVYQAHVRDRPGRQQAVAPPPPLLFPPTLQSHASETGCAVPLKLWQHRSEALRGMTERAAGRHCPLGLCCDWNRTERE